MKKFNLNWIVMIKTKAMFCCICRILFAVIAQCWDCCQQQSVWPSLVHMGWMEAGWVWAAYYYAALFDQRRRCLGGSVAQLQPRAGLFWLNFDPLSLWIEPIERVARVCLDVSCELCGSRIASVSHGWVGGGPLTQVGKGGGKSCLHFVPNGACAASASPHHLPGMDISHPNKKLPILVVDLVIESTGTMSILLLN